MDLLTTAFKRFKGESDTGVVKLTQAMGGLEKLIICLHWLLLAQNRTWRNKILGKRI